MASEQTNIQIAKYVDENEYCSKKQITEYVSKIVTSVTTDTINKTIDKLTVNHKGRVHYDLNQHARFTNENNKADKLYKIDSEHYVSYNPLKHGIWEVYKTEINKWTIRQHVAQDEAQQFQEEFDKAIQIALSLSQEERIKRLNNVKNTRPVAKQVLCTVYDRNPDVVAEVLSRAKGYCEKCLKPAPFQRAKNGTPYLEVHHVRPLAKGGCDTINNAIALCPNCHRQQHYG